jgi:hypothetical protein
MNVQLTEEERDILIRLVRREIAELGPEIRHTDAADYRDELRAHKRILQELSGHLNTPPET